MDLGSLLSPMRRDVGTAWVLSANWCANTLYSSVASTMHKMRAEAEPAFRSGGLRLRFAVQFGVKSPLNIEPDFGEVKAQAWP